MTDKNSINPEALKNNLDLVLALQLAGLGWRVFPCGLDKRPLTANGFKDSTSDPEEIRAWAWPLIGVYCEGSGFFAVDVDVKGGADGLASWAQLITDHSSEPVNYGPAQLTPSGGKHFLFKLPQNIKVPNNAGKLGPGLDLRSNGYICTGAGYTWQPGHGPEVPLTEAPGWLLGLIAKMASKPAAQAVPVGGLASEQTDPGAYWLAHYLAEARPGNRNNAGWALACQLRDSKIPEGKAREIMLNFAARAPQPGGLERYTEAEALASLKSAYTGTPREPATLPSISDHHNGGHPSPPEPEEPALIITTWADMAGVIGPVEWSWPGWLPKGMLTILAGESGAGKSALALRLAACYIRGDSWPDGQKFTGEPGAVVWCEAEAAQALNLDRAKAWGLPIEKIYTPLSDPLADVKLDIPEHAAALAKKALLPEVRLIVVDSLRGMHRGDENSSETMNTIKWLAELARDSGKELLLTHHLRKRSIFDGEGVELERLRGSSAIVQTARMVWALDVPDPQTKDLKRLQVIKSNLAKFPAPVGVTVNEAGVKFVAAPEPPKVETKVSQAVDLLMALLQKGPLSADEVVKEFNDAGISVPTMNRAKSKLGVISGRNKNGWFWSLPAKEDPIL